MFTGKPAITDHGVLVHPRQAAGLADPTAFGDMLQDRHHFVFRQAAIKQGRALAFREAYLASSAIQHTSLFVGTIAHGNTEIPQAALTVIGTLRILAAKARQVVHTLPSMA